MKLQELFEGLFNIQLSEAINLPHSDYKHIESIVKHYYKLDKFKNITEFQKDMEIVLNQIIEKYNPHDKKYTITFSIKDRPIVDGKEVNGYASSAFSDINVGYIVISSKLLNNHSPNYDNVTHVIIHELTHILQVVNRKNPSVGYGRKREYYERPVEIDAFAKQITGLIIHKVYQSYKKNNFKNLENIIRISLSTISAAYKDYDIDEIQYLIDNGMIPPNIDFQYLSDIALFPTSVTSEKTKKRFFKKLYENISFELEHHIYEFDKNIAIFHALLPKLLSENNPIITNAFTTIFYNKDYSNIDSIIKAQIQKLKTIKNDLSNDFIKVLPSISKILQHKTMRTQIINDVKSYMNPKYQKELKFGKQYSKEELTERKKIKQELVLKYKDIINSREDLRKLSPEQVAEIRKGFPSDTLLYNWIVEFKKNSNDILNQRNNLAEKYKNIIHSVYDLRKLSPLQKSEIRKVFPHESILYHWIEKIKQ